MKNKAEPHWSQNDYDKHLFILLCGPRGFSGYYVDRFNDVYSVRRPKTPLSPWENVFPSGVTVERLNLFDDEGKRRQVSRRKVLIGTLGKEEFEHRENLRKNRVGILEKEAQENAIIVEQNERERQKNLDEMHKNDFAVEYPAHLLDPIVAKMVKEGRQRRAEALGEMF